MPRTNGKPAPAVRDADFEEDIQPRPTVTVPCVDVRSGKTTRALIARSPQDGKLYVGLYMGEHFIEAWADTRELLAFQSVLGAAIKRATVRGLLLPAEG